MWGVYMKNIYCRHTNFGAGSEYNQELARKYLSNDKWYKVVRISKYSFGTSVYVENLPDTSFDADIFSFAVEREDGKAYLYDFKEDPDGYLKDGKYLNY